jgi:hypothetical protein
MKRTRAKKWAGPYGYCSLPGPKELSYNWAVCYTLTSNEIHSSPVRAPPTGLAKSAADLQDVEFKRERERET